MKWQIVKAVLYLLIALAIFIFVDKIMPYVGYLVGGVVLLYAFEELLVSAVNRLFFTDFHCLCDGITQLLVGVALFLVAGDVLRVCLIWGVWSILRESKEMAQAVENIAKKRVDILNLIESVVVIVLSFLLILEPNEQHVRLHVVLLGIELITVVLFYFLDLFYTKRTNHCEADESDDGSYNESREIPI